MRVLAACSLGGASHLNALLPFLEGAARQGHETLVVGPRALAEMLATSGYEFRAGGEPTEREVAAIRERLPVVEAHEASVLANRELFGRLATSAMSDVMEAVTSQWHPDLILREPCEYSSAIAAGRHGVPVAQVAISLAEGEAASIAVASPALEEHRPGLTQELMASPYLSAFPASFDPSPFGETTRFRQHADTSSDPLPGWWGDGGGPLVYATFGTVLGYMSIAEEVYRTLLEAVSGLDARVLLTLGNRFDPSGLGDVPANVHLEPWVDQARVMREAAAVVCHGGSGTVLGALRAAVPMLLVPLFADQFENARRVAVAGAGVALEAPRCASEERGPHLGPHAAARIRALAEEVIADHSYARAAAVLAEEMRRFPTVEDVLGGLLPAS